MVKKQIVFFIACVATLVTQFTVLLQADMKYDPVTDRIFTLPASPEINQHEYLYLLFQCVIIGTRIETFIRFEHLSPILKDDIIKNRIYSYLRSVGTPTALRLIEDLDKMPTKTEMLGIYE